MWANFLEHGSSTRAGGYEALQQQLISEWQGRNKPSANGEKGFYTQLEARIYRAGDALHLCTENCMNHPIWCKENNMTGKILDVFINKTTGQHHICNGVACGAKHIFTTGQSTCTISGLQWSSDEYINNFKLRHEYHRSSSSVVRVEGQLLRQITDKLIHTFLFSAVRVRTELKRVHDTRKEIHKHWIKTKRELDRQGKRANVMELLSHAHFIERRRGVRRFQMPSEDTKQMIIDFYSNRVTGIFLKLKEVCKKFPIETLTKSFVCAILYSMRKGVTISDVPVIPKDYYLKSSLPQCNMLDAYGINKTHFTAASTTILVSLREAVLDGVNPHHLLVSSLH